jgi:membrane protein
MELVKRNYKSNLKALAIKIYDDNLFLLSSSISYYSALAIAPFLLILLGVAAFLGGDVQDKVIALASEFSYEVGQMIALIFANVNEGVNIGTLSGLLGVIILLSTASLVFSQMRYSLDVIYGILADAKNVSIWSYLLEKIVAMFAVIMAGIFLIISSSLPGVISFFFGTENENYFIYRAGAFAINFFIYIAMFWFIHYFTPTRHPGKREALKMGILSSIFFIIGNILLGTYLRNVAVGSIYGAAGSLLIFLIWTYYSSFTMFLSVEVFLYFRKMRKMR